MNIFKLKKRIKGIIEIGGEEKGCSSDCPFVSIKSGDWYCSLFDIYFENSIDFDRKECKKFLGK